MGHGVLRSRVRMRRVGYGVIGLAFLLVGMSSSFGLATTAQAANFSVTVTTTTDVNDDCATTGVAPCSLRDAIHYANTKTTADTTTITLPAGTYNLTQTGACGNTAIGDLRISENLILNGADPATTIINGTGNDRVLTMTSGTRTVSITNVTIQHGSANPGCGSIGGGINMVGSVTLTNVIVTNNVARFAGGINAVGNLTLINSTVSNNVACSTGGISSGNGVLTLTNSTVSGNTATSSSAALTSVGGCPGAARGYAGGIDTSDLTHLTNSTISGNSNTYGNSDDSGGIRNGNALTIAYSTIAGNSNPGIAAGIVNRAPGSVTIQGSIIAGNAGGNCANAGALTSQGYNLSTDSTCALAQPTDLIAVPANLAPLAANGGPTQTHALLAGSLAIDAGGTGASGCPAADQRYIARPQGARCDIGAYEAVGLAGPTPTITGVYPPSGPIAGGSKVTISGMNLQPGTVSLGGAPCTVTSATGATLTCLTSSHSAGTVGITVTNPGGQSVTQNNVYTYGVLNPLPVSQPSGANSGNPASLPAPRPTAVPSGTRPNPLPIPRP
jgi:CSLREA domain-containing protein